VDGLGKAIRNAVQFAQTEARNAAHAGYRRAPRIRFSHIRDMAATPEFTNALATAIKRLASDVLCVMYTRHPNASHLDPALFVVNFSIDGDQDVGLRFASRGSRIVCSAWDGAVAKSAQVAFWSTMWRVFIRLNVETVCPVTARHRESVSCNAADCDKCFEPEWALTTQTA